MSKANGQATTTDIAIELTRRSTFSALLVSAALASPAVAAGVCADPIFSLIDAHKVARAAFSASLENEPSFSDKAAHDEWERRGYGPSDAEQAATRALLTTAPTTLAGTLALLRYMQETDTDGEAYHDTDCGEAGDGFTALVGSLVVALAPLVQQ